MALTGIALIGNQGMHGTSRAEFTYRFTVTLDGSYPASGGYTGFLTAVQAALLVTDKATKAAVVAVAGSTAPYPPATQSGLVGKTCISIRQVSFGGGYKCWWTRATDKLLVAHCGGSAAPDAECSLNEAGLSGVAVEFEGKFI